MDAGKNTCETVAIKIGSKISLNHHSHFIEHLMNVFKKSHAAIKIKKI
jgi:biotin synthase-related radical SAM superfamily protein